MNAEHARALMRSVGAAVSVVMVDLSLATDNGFDLIAELHRHYPSVPVIAISGVYSADVLDSATVFGAAATTVHIPAQSPNFLLRLKTR